MRMDTLPKEESTVREKAKERTTLEHSTFRDLTEEKNQQSSLGKSARKAAENEI